MNRPKQIANGIAVSLLLLIGLAVDAQTAYFRYGRLPKPADVLAAARTFVNSSSPEDQMFVVNFNEHVIMGLPATIGFTDRVEELERAISHTPAAGRTALYDAVMKAQEQLQAGSRDKKVLIVISDGGEAFFPAERKDVMSICESIARDIRHQYVLGYVSSNAARNGSYRSVRVIARALAKKLSVRSRAGYIAANESRPSFEAIK